MMRFGILMMMVVGMLTGCISGTTPTDSYTNKTGKTTLIQSDREQCTRSCNEEYSRCMDTQAARQSPVAGAPDGMFGASSDCRSALKDCLPDCRSR